MRYKTDKLKRIGDQNVLYWNNVYDRDIKILIRITANGGKELSKSIFEI